MRGSHQTPALRAETSSWFQSDPSENQFWHKDDSYLPQKKKAIFFLCRLDCLQSAFSLVACSGFSCSITLQRKIRDCSQSICRSSFRSEFSDRGHYTGFRDKSIVFLHFSQKFRGCQPGLLSIKFDFRNVIFQPMVFPFVWAKYKWKVMRDRCKLSFPRSLAARFDRPNRRACLSLISYRSISS